MRVRLGIAISGAVALTESHIPQLALKLRSQKIEQILLATYQTTDRLPSSVRIAAAAHPDLIRFDAFKVVGRFGSVREEHVTDEAAQIACERVIEAINKLGNLVAEVFPAEVA